MGCTRTQGRVEAELARREQAWVARELLADRLPADALVRLLVDVLERGSLSHLDLTGRHDIESLVRREHLEHVAVVAEVVLLPVLITR